MRRWRKILLFGACAILAIVAGAWLLRDALAAGPPVVRLANQTTLSFYAATRGTNQSQFPEPSPFKRLWASARRILGLKTGIHRTAGRHFDDDSAFWWFKVNSTLHWKGADSPVQVAMREKTNYLSGQMNPVMMLQPGPPEIFGLGLVVCPTNTPTLIMYFSSIERGADGRPARAHYVTNITVPNAMYGR